MLITGEISAFPVILIVVFAIARLLPFPETYHPLSLFRYFASQLAVKVNPPGRSEQQQKLSGFLAILVSIIPFIIVLYGLYQFSGFPFLLDALLLYFSLNWRTDAKRANEIAVNIQRQQLTLARSQSRSLLLRDTDKLTPMGLSKACLESLIFRSSYQVLAVFFWFICGGGIAVICYRLLHELQQQWNSKLTPFRYFGAAISSISTLLALPAMLLSCLLFMLQGSVTRARKLYLSSPRLYFSMLQQYLLCAASVALAVKLGGPVYYAGKKFSRSRIGKDNEPGTQAISRCLSLLSYQHIFVLLLIALCPLWQIASLLIVA